MHGIRNGRGDRDHGEDAQAGTELSRLARRGRPGAKPPHHGAHPGQEQPTGEGLDAGPAESGQRQGQCRHHGLDRTGRGWPTPDLAGEPGHHDGPEGAEPHVRDRCRLDIAGIGGPQGEREPRDGGEEHLDGNGPHPTPDHPQGMPIACRRGDHRNALGGPTRMRLWRAHACLPMETSARHEGRGAVALASPPRTRARARHNVTQHRQPTSPSPPAHREPGQR